MTFYEPARKLPVAAFVVFLIVAGVGSVIFFSLKECKSSGIFRSGSSSDATELYQVFPASDNNQLTLVSVEGVYKTRLYERRGGITTRSGNTDIRISVHSLANGELLNRLVVGDYHDSYTKILGVRQNKMWLYSAKDGLHSMSVPQLEMIIEEPAIVSGNRELSEGLPKQTPIWAISPNCLPLMKARIH
jgi:hypothetical protein